MRHILIFFFIISSIKLCAQDAGLSKYSLQLDVGMSNTLHYNQPVYLLNCIEGCYPEEQTGKIAPSVDLSIYRALNNLNSIKIGVGFAEYRFEERGLDYGAGYYESEVVDFDYIDISAGFRHIFKSNYNISPFVETDLRLEIIGTEMRLLKKSGLASKIQAGAIYKLSNKWRGSVAGFYKTGLVRYNNDLVEKKYIPYGYGIQLGFNLKI